MVLYLPLSYYYPEFVKMYALESPPLIWWRTDAEAIVASTLNTLMLVVLGPIVEEFLFRGFLLNRLLRQYGAVTAVVVSSMLFALLHPDILGAFVFAVILSMIYLKTRSLIGPIIIHIASNAIVLLLIVGDAMMTGNVSNPSLSEFQSSWWLAPIGAVVGIPWLVWFFKIRINRLEQCATYQGLF